MDPRTEVIHVFKNALVKNKVGLRIKNLVGYLASRNRRHLRKWFVKMYPNPADYILFIHEHPNHFDYDPLTGLITARDVVPEKKKATTDNGDSIPNLCNLVTKMRTSSPPATAPPSMPSREDDARLFDYNF